MTCPTYQIGQIVNYTNGQPCVYTGTIVKIRIGKSGTHLIVIDDAAGMQLWNAGIACGSDIHENQVIN